MDLKTFLENFDTIAEAPGGIPKLRSLILDLAVRGKLVPQNPDDEPAIFLVKQTIASKQKLLKAKKIRKTETLFPPEDLIKTELPLDKWVVAPLGMLCFLLVDGSHNPPPKQEKGIPMLSGQNVRDGYITLDASRYITEKDYEQEMSRTPIQAGDVFLSIVGSIGRSAVVPEKFPRCALQRSIALIRTDLYSHYLSLFLRSPIALQYYEQHGKGTAQKGIYLNKLSELEVVIPPLAEQKRIVEKVDELMGLCDRYESAKQERDNLRQKLRESAIASLMNAETDKELDAAWAFVRDNWHNLSQNPEDINSLRKSVLQLAIRGKLVPQHPNDEPASDLLEKLKFEKEQLLQEKRFLKSEKLAAIKLEDLSYNIPEEWALTRIGVVCGSVVPNRDKPKTFSGGFPWVTLSNFDERSIKLRNNHSGIGLSKEEVVEFNARIIPNRSVLMSCVGRFGLVAVLEQDVVTNQQIHGFVIPNSLYPEYVAYVIKAHTEFLESSATSTTVAYLNKTRCESIPFPLPPLAEQKRIVAKVDELMQLCDRLETSLRESQQRAESLAASAISKLKARDED